MKHCRFWNRLAVSFALGEFLNAPVVPGDFLYSLIVTDEVFRQRFVEQSVAKIQTAQPLQMFFRPVGAFTVKMPVARAEGDRLLLDALELGLHILPHADVFLDRVVFLRWDVDGAVGVVRKAAADASGVHAVVLHTLSGRDGHGGWRENDTFNTVLCELMVQGVTEAAGLIAAEKADTFAALGTDAVEVFEDLPMIRLDLDLGENAVFFHGIAANACNLWYGHPRRHRVYLT